MHLIDTFFGHGANLNPLQMSVRAITIFFFALMLIRFSGMRIFGIKSAFDICITIMLGAVLARAVVGASPFIPTIVASTMLVVIHKLLAMASMNNHWIGTLVKGSHLSVYKNGVLNSKNMKSCSISYNDILEEVRLSLHQNSLENIEEIFMERSGKISFVKIKT
jgi:uncharacterized membrane protein YcaP (DUF421 family)